MSTKEIRRWANTDDAMGPALRDFYEMLLPAEVAKIKYCHPSILAALETKHGLIDDMCREAGRFFVAGSADAEACARLSDYMDELATALATVVTPLLYFSAKPGAEREITALFAARFAARLTKRVDAHIYAGKETSGQGGQG